MKIEIKKFEKLLVKAASRFVSKKEAEYFSKEHLDTYVKKYPRVNALKTAITDLEDWLKNPKKKFIIKADKKASLLIDCNKLAPAVKLKYLHDELEKRAKKYGISMIGLNNCGGFHTLNVFTDGLGKRDLVGICVYNGGPGGVVAYGGRDGLFGTNPISYSIPTKKEPIIADMATSQIPFFELSQAKKNNKKLKIGAGVNTKGEPTTDPKECLTDDGIGRILPIGGSYKGYIINLLIEVITGSLVGSLLSTEMSEKYINEEHGGLIIAIDVSSFTSLTKFKKSVTKMCYTVRKQKPAKGVDKVLIPGDNSYQRKKQLLKTNKIVIDKEVLQKLKEVTKY
ncbi:Ldh family oxidoreductase [Patescibacteria group bacterium]